MLRLCFAVDAECSAVNACSALSVAGGHGREVECETALLVRSHGREPNGGCAWRKWKEVGQTSWSVNVPS